MFGYITIAGGALSEERRQRYRAMYCGLCHTLKERFGAAGQMTLSYDITFLYMLLSSLYEPAEEQKAERCLPHPVRPHPYVCNELADYCCDMNIGLAYHKCMDDWNDDRSAVGKAEAALLKKGYEAVCKRHPEKCQKIEECLKALGQVEKNNGTLDEAANLFGEILGTLCRYQEDLWADDLTALGRALGRFIYLMDAYDDLPKDLHKKRFNPLRAHHQREDYEAFVKDSLTMLIGECTEIFETLPLVQDMDILRNILYAGCWMRYEQLQSKRNHKEDGA